MRSPRRRVGRYEDGTGCMKGCMIWYRGWCKILIMQCATTAKSARARAIERYTGGLSDVRWMQRETAPGSLRTSA